MAAMKNKMKIKKLYLNQRIRKQRLKGRKNRLKKRKKIKIN
jgi:hypothetical protein